MKIKLNIYRIVIIVFLIIAIFMELPDIMRNINAEKLIMKDSILKSELSKYNIISINYKGNDSYEVTTDKEAILFVREYTSFMNYKWRIYEYKHDMLN